MGGNFKATSSGRGFLLRKSDTIEIARKNLIDAFNEIETIITDFSHSLTVELSERLEEAEKTFQQEHKITVPKVDLKSIENKAKKNAYKMEDVYGEREADVWDYVGLGIPMIFRENRIKIGEKQVYDKKQHLKSLKKQYRNELDKLILEFNFTKRFGDYTSSCLEYFIKEMNAVIAERQKALEKEKNEKQSNYEIIAEIDSLKEKKKRIQPELKRVEAILEDIK